MSNSYPKRSMRIPAPPAPARANSEPITTTKGIFETMSEPGTYALRTNIHDGKTSFEVERIGDSNSIEEIEKTIKSDAETLSLSRLHDEFAMHALMGICANDYWGMQRPEKVVTRVRAIANEMINQRRKFWRDTDER